VSTVATPFSGLIMNSSVATGTAASGLECFLELLDFLVWTSESDESDIKT